MKTLRSPGQKLIPIPVSDAFVQELDNGLNKIGFSNRSQFIRDAILEKLERAGRSVPRGYSQAPGRAGKGGRPRKGSSKAKKSASRRR
jgi:hypothetical protein